MKHLFIINPNSGNKKIHSILTMIEELVKTYNLEYDVIITKYQNHVQKIFQSINTKNIRVYLFGGDGTINNAIQSIPTDLEIAFIPIGSGNDFYRYFQSNSDIKKIIEESINGQCIKVDLGEVDGKRFVNSFSLGFDANVAKDADNLIRKGLLQRHFAYQFAALKNLVNPKFTKIDLEIDGENQNIDTLIFAVLNGRYYGGGFNPTPLAYINDNKLDLCLVEKINHLQIINLLKKFMNGTHLQTKSVHYYQNATFHVSSENIFTYEIDGEIFEANDLIIKVLPSYLSLVVPKIFINTNSFK